MNSQLCVEMYANCLLKVFLLISAWTSFSPGLAAAVAHDAAVPMQAV